VDKACPGDAILIRFAVLEEGVSEVIRKYGIVGLLPLSDPDPIILMQQGGLGIPENRRLSTNILHLFLRVW
jgi:hypothetical protein